MSKESHRLGALALPIPADEALRGAMQVPPPDGDKPKDKRRKKQTKKRKVKRKKKAAR